MRTWAVSGRRGGPATSALVRLAICASAVKYDWLTPYCLEHASADEHLEYGGSLPADADARYAGHATALAMCVRWAEEAERLARGRS